MSKVTPQQLASWPATWTTLHKEEGWTWDFVEGAAKYFTPNHDKSNQGLHGVDHFNSEKEVLQFLRGTSKKRHGDTVETRTKKCRVSYATVREQHAERIMYFVSNGTGFMHIGGLPGTGKTMTMDCVISTVNDESLHYIYLNCSGVRDPRKFYQDLCEGLGSKVQPDAAETWFYNFTLHDACRRTVLVLDEVNCLGFDNTDLATALRNIVASAFEFPSRLSVIGISNTLDQRWQTVLPGGLGNPDKFAITFPAYTSAELQAVLKAHFGHLSQKVALAMVATKVASESGDARAAITICAAAAAESPDHSVTFQAVRRVMFRQQEAESIAKRLAALSFRTKLFTASCLRLRAKMSADFTLADIFRVYTRACHDVLHSEVYDTESQLKTLETCGALTSRTTKDGQVISLKVTKGEFLESLTESEAFQLCKFCS